MKYIVLILILMGCKSTSEKKVTETPSPASNTVQRTYAKSEKKEQFEIPVESLFEAIEFTKDSYLINDLTSLSYSEIISLISYLEVPVDDKFLKQSLKKIGTENVRAFFYKFDFTNDGVKDIIYMSNWGAEEVHTVLWEKRNDAYKFINFSMGTVQKAYRYSDKEPYSFLVSSDACLAMIVDYSIYRPIIKNKEISYSKQIKYKIFVDLEYPSLIHQSIKFETLNKNYRLRINPVIDETRNELFSEFERKDVYGNVIAEFEIGSKGIAISTKKDSLKTWWFVVMDTSSKTSYNLFYNDKNSHKVGWMSSKYLKTLNDGL